MIRRFGAVLCLLLMSACTSTEPSSSAPASPTAPADQNAAVACANVARLIQEQDVRVNTNSMVVARAVRAADPGVKEAGQRLAVVWKEAGDLWVKNDPGVDLGPVNARMAEAQRGLLSACTALFGAQPWSFDKRPSPTSRN
ncbi:hypothetical protein [Micromonospora maritima]|uniref:hypothetical protein n=1 Tax=Micromonospora maritima TaxID=986711 RepID=UPI00378FB218